MFNPKGQFAWYELMTTDTAAAKKFYGEVLGWTNRDVGSPEMPYATFNVSDFGVAGLLATPPGAVNLPPHWLGYIAVEDVDAHVARIVEVGGKLCKPVTRVPGMLRFAVVMDPQGAAFVVFTSDPQMQSPPERPAFGTPGTSSWTELITTDQEEAFNFYSGMFGWTKAEAHDMGPMGSYQLFAIGGQPAGGMMTKPPFLPKPVWNYYFQVEGAQAAADRITSAGGKISHGPAEVPGGGWIVQAVDPQGAMFCLTSASA